MAGRRKTSLEELRQRHLVDGQPIPTGLIARLRKDERAGAEVLATALEQHRKAGRKETQRLERLLTFENELWAAGHVHLAGVDEAGVGPLVGSVIAGAAILQRGYTLEGLDDSKKIHSEARRDELADAIKRDAVAWAVGEATVEEIDRLNIYQAGLLAMRRAVEGLSTRPDFVLVDARTIPGLPMPQRGIIKGDAQSLSIAAGAILAKTTRDAQMRALHAQHPQYGFAQHKGYPAPVHLAALKEHGALPEHRRSFGPVRDVLGLGPRQQGLFS